MLLKTALVMENDGKLEHFGLELSKNLQSFSSEELRTLKMTKST